MGAIAHPPKKRHWQAIIGRVQRSVTDESCVAVTRRLPSSHTVTNRIRFSQLRQPAEFDHRNAIVSSQSESSRNDYFFSLRFTTRTPPTFNTFGVRVPTRRSWSAVSNNRCHGTLLSDGYFRGITGIIRACRRASYITSLVSPPPSPPVEGRDASSKRRINVSAGRSSVLSRR